MWFDMALIDESSISEFYPIVESKNIFNKMYYDGGS